MVYVVAAILSVFRKPAELAVLLLYKFNDFISRFLLSSTLLEDRTK
jgi:hypothetical protein